MSATPAYFEQSYRGPEPVDQLSNPYWNDHYNNLYQQYQNYYQTQNGMFSHKQDHAEEQCMTKRIPEEKLNIKTESENSTSCDAQTNLSCDRSRFFTNDPSRFYEGLHQDRQSDYQNPIVPSQNVQHYFDQTKLNSNKTNLPPFQYHHYDKFPGGDKNPASPGKTPALAENYFDCSRLPEGSPHLGHFTPEDPVGPKFVDVHMRQPLAQQHLRNLYSVESNNNGGPRVTPAESVKNALPDASPGEDNHIYPWMKTSFHKG